MRRAAGRRVRGRRRGRGTRSTHSLPEAVNGVGLLVHDETRGRSDAIAMLTSSDELTNRSTRRGLHRDACRSRPFAQGCLFIGGQSERHCHSRMVSIRHRSLAADLQSVVSGRSDGRGACNPCQREGFGDRPEVRSRADVMWLGPPPRAKTMGPSTALSLGPPAHTTATDLDSHSHAALTDRRELPPSRNTAISSSAPASAAWAVWVARWRRWVRAASCRR